MKVEVARLGVSYAQNDPRRRSCAQDQTRTRSCDISCDMARMPLSTTGGEGRGLVWWFRRQGKWHLLRLGVSLRARAARHNRRAPQWPVGRKFRGAPGFQWHRVVARRQVPHQHPPQTIRHGPVVENEAVSFLPAACAAAG